MNVFKLVSTIMVLSLFSREAWSTKIFLHDAVSKLGRLTSSGNGYGCFSGANATVYRLANASQGSSAVTDTFTPSATASPCQGQTANSGEFLVWASPPLSSAVTISGNINAQGYCSQSANANNMGFRFVVYRWSAKTGGIVSTVQTSGWGNAECTSATAATAKTIAAAAPTSTAFSVGDRIVITVEVGAVGGTWGGNGSRTFSFIFDGAAAASGDTWINFTETLNFSADSSPALPRVQ